MNAQGFEVASYEAMHKWVTGGKVGPDPRGEWEWKYSMWHDSAWVASKQLDAPLFGAEKCYRWKPAKKRTVTLDGVELVAPEVDVPAEKVQYFYEHSGGNIRVERWEGLDFDKTILSNGKLFLTHEDCQAMSDVQRKQRLGETK